MQLLIIRHAIAEEKDVWAKTGKPDELRPLTTDGKRKMRKAAKGIRALVTGVDVLASSPLVRARQTAEIVSREYEGHEIETVHALVPGSPLEDFEKWAAAQTGATIAVVGHEPHLSELITWLLTGSAGSKVVLKKGGACLLEFDGQVAKGKAVLVWSAPPALLRG